MAAAPRALGQPPSNLPPPPPCPPPSHADLDQQAFVITDATKLRLGYEWEAQLWRRRVPKKTLLSKFKIMGKEELDKLVVVSGWPWAGGHAQLGRVGGGRGRAP